MSSTVVHPVKVVTFMSGPDEGFNHQILNDLMEQGFEFKQALLVNNNIRYILTHASGSNNFRSDHDNSIAARKAKSTQLNGYLESAKLANAIRAADHMSLEEVTANYRQIQESSRHITATDSVNSVDLNILAAQWCLLQYKTSVIFAHMST